MNTKTHPKLLLALTLAASIWSVSAHADCGKPTSVPGDSCENLTVNVDASACGGSANHKMTVDSCKGEEFSGTIQTSTHVLKISGKGSMWAGKVNWSADTIKISSTASVAKVEEPKAKIEEPKSEVVVKPKELKKDEVKKDDEQKTAKVEKKKKKKKLAMPMPPARKGKHPASELEPEPEPSPALKAIPAVVPVPVPVPVSAPAVTPVPTPETPAATSPATSSANPAVTTTPAVPAATAPTAAAVAPVPAPAPAPVAASDKKDEPSYSLFGDIRHRQEKVINENPDAGKNEKYEQFRLRARLGVKAQPTTDTMVEFRLATGSGGISTNQTYGETIKGSRNYDFKLDRAYAKYTPHANVNLSVGRMANQFSAVGDNDMLFDSDLNFDGYLIGLEHKGSQGKVYARGGQYVLEEVKDAQSSHEVTLGIAQLGATFVPGNGFTFGIVATNHKYGNVKDHAALLTGDFGGNSNASSKYLNNYNVTSYGAELTYDWKFPIVLFYESASNSDVSDENKASIYGIKLGKLKNAGDWALAADSRELKKDSTMGIMTDGDAYGGGTNGRTSRVSLGYNLTKFIGITLTNFKGQKNILPTETPVSREKWQLDFNIKF